MNHEKLFEIAKIAKDKGFEAKTVTTTWTNNYLLGIGKDMFINNMCFYLWACEVQMWLQEEHNLNLNIVPYFGKQYDKGLQLWELLSVTDLKEEQNYVSRLRFETYKESLIEGLQQSLTIIQNV